MAPRACLFVEPLMIDLTSVLATQNPSGPRMVCTTRMVVVTAASDGGLLSPLREFAMKGANAQNGTIHRRMSNTPTRRRKGTGQPISCPLSWTIHRSCRFPTPSSRPWALVLSHSTVMAVPLLARPYDHLWLITACADVHGRPANRQEGVAQDALW